MQKTYWAIVEKSPDSNAGVLEHYLIKNQQKNKSRAYLKPFEGALKSTLLYKISKTLDRYTLLEIKPITGRHHQIRIQLSKIGSVIKGDLKYGAKRSNKDGNISLHARKLTIIHPVTKELLCFTADPIRVGIWRSVLFD